VQREREERPARGEDGEGTRSSSRATFLSREIFRKICCAAKSSRGPERKREGESLVTRSRLRLACKGAATFFFPLAPSRLQSSAGRVSLAESRCSTLPRMIRDASKVPINRPIVRRSIISAWNRGSAGNRDFLRDSASVNDRDLGPCQARFRSRSAN